MLTPESNKPNFLLAKGLGFVTLILGGVAGIFISVFICARFKYGEPGFRIYLDAPYEFKDDPVNLIAVVIGASFGAFLGLLLWKCLVKSFLKLNDEEINNLLKKK